MLTGRAILFFLALFYVYGAGIHLASLLGLTGADWSAAPLEGQVADVGLILLNTAVVILVFAGRSLGVALMALASAGQIALYTLGRDGLAGADTLVGLHVLCLGLIALALYFMKDGWARETPPACG